MSNEKDKLRGAISAFTRVIGAAQAEAKPEAAPTTPEEAIAEELPTRPAPLPPLEASEIAASGEG